MEGRWVIETAEVEGRLPDMVDEGVASNRMETCLPRVPLVNFFFRGMGWVDLDSLPPCYDKNIVTSFGIGALPWLPTLISICYTLPNMSCGGE